MRRTDEEETEKAFNDDLMDSYNNNMTDIFSKLSRFRKEVGHNDKISEIETLKGTFTGPEVLEGFRQNTEHLCSDNPNEHFQEDFLQQCRKDHIISNDIVKDEARNIPYISFEKLKEIVSKKLKIKGSMQQLLFNTCTS